MKLKDYFGKYMIWNASGDPDIPFKTVHDGVTMSVRLNDFPSEHLYTLIADGSTVSFDDWPKLWTKSGSRKPQKVSTPLARAKAKRYSKAAAKTASRNGPALSRNPAKIKSKSLRSE